MKTRNIMEAIRKIFMIFIIAGFAVLAFSLVLYKFNSVAVFADITQKNNYELIESSYSGELNKVNITLHNENININTHDEDDIIITYYKHNRLSKTTESFEEGNFLFKTGFKWSFVQVWNLCKYRTIELLLPVSFSGDVNILSHNGFVNVKDLTASNLIVENYNGAITVENSIVDNMQIINRNGAIRLIESRGDNAKLTCNNGSVSVSKGGFINLEVRNNNGKNNVELIGVLSDYRVELSHGNGKSYLNGERASGVVSWGEIGKVYMRVDNGDNYLRFF